MTLENRNIVSGQMKVVENNDCMIPTEEMRNSFVNALPFHHIVIDNFFNNEFLYYLFGKFPSHLEKKWWTYDNPLEKKLAFNDLSQLDSSFEKYFDFLNSKEFISFLENLSGLNDLIPDSELNGGGLHQILKNGKLDVHEDFNIHKGLQAFRKLNVIVYLNPEWKEEFGGHLEIWNKDMTQCARKILPLFNRMVIFRTDMNSNHGHPHPLNCPDYMTRKSLATYYYTKDDAVISTPYKSTVYKKLPGVEEPPEIEELRKMRSKGRLSSN